jgi:predicted dehydrogenase
MTALLNRSSEDDSMIRVTVNSASGDACEIVVNPDRCLPSRQLIRQQLDAGQIGDVGMVRVHRWEPREADATDEVLGLPAAFVRDLDVVLWLVGQSPNSVYAVEQSASEPGHSRGQLLQVHLGFPSGAMALLDFADRLPPGEGYQSLSVIGSAGAAYADDHQNMQLVFRGGRPQAVRADESGRRHTALVQETIEALRVGGDVAAHVGDWQNVVKVAEAVRESIATRFSGNSSGEPAGVSPRPSDDLQFVRGLTHAGSPFRCAVVSAVKHDYVARGLATHPRFKLVVVTDDPGIPDWAHERNQQFADAQQIPYVRDVERALREFDVQVAIVSPEAERHVDLSVRAAVLGKHVVQDKPLTTRLSEADRLVAEIERSGVKFLMWNRNFIPAVVQAREQIAAGAIGQPYAVHLDFYFAKDAGPPKGSRQLGYPPMAWQSHLIAAHVDGSDGGLGVEPMGELAIEGIYPLGYLRMLTGREVRRVFARSASHFHQLNADNGVEDLASVSLELDNGLIASVAIGRIGAASHPSGGEIKLHVLGSDGALVVSESRPEVGVYYRGQPTKEFRQRRIANDNDFLLAENFANAIDTGGETILDARASRAIYATVAAALESCRTGQPIEVR